jgi:type VI secretion system protein ImpJ
MDSLSQVVWSEGMHLGPHEFQAQARFFESAIHFSASALWFQGWGVTSYKLDEDALRNGTVSVLHASGIFPDGAPFLIPQADRIPPVREIGELFLPTQDNLTIFLAIAAFRPQGPNCAINDGQGDARYASELQTFADETTGSDTRSIHIRRKNIRLLIESELSDGIVNLPLARVKRDGKGHFIFDSAFIPPCLQISGSHHLMMLVRRLIEILEAKSLTLSRSNSGEAGVARFSSRDVANFWLLHAVNTGLSTLRHLWIAKRGHPEELFMEMSRLGAALCTFALESDARKLPIYDHRQLSHGFALLDEHIRTHLEIIIPTNCITIPLVKVADWFYEGEVNDTRCFGKARWILGINAKLGEVDLINKTPDLVKICSAKFIGELVRRAVSGLTLNHLPTPPAAISARVEDHYFGISREGPFWQSIVDTRRVGLYVPADLPEPELELLVVLEK